MRRENFNRPEKDRRNNYNTDIIDRLSKTSRGLERDLIEPIEEIPDGKEEELHEKSDYFHEHTYSDKREAKAMERKINAYKRNRSDFKGFGSFEAKEARGD